MVHSDVTIRDGLKGLLATGNFSDLLLKLGDRTWTVHKAVLCIQSSFFTKACGGRFKEAGEGVIELHDDDSDTVSAMLHYLYHGDLSTFTATSSCTKSIFYVKTYILADKYDIEDLKSQAIHGFSCEVQGVWEDDGVVREIVAEVSGTDPLLSPLRDIVVTALQKYAERLAKDRETGMSRLKSTLANAPELAPDLAFCFVQQWELERSKSKLHEGEKRYKCPGRCGSSTMVFRIEHPSPNHQYPCIRCRAPWTGATWEENVVEE